MEHNDLRPIKRGLLLFAASLLLCSFVGPTWADKDLEQLGMPVFYGEDDEEYGLIVTEYQASTEAKLVRKKDVTHEIELLGYIRPSEDDDIIGFSTTLEPKKALTEDGDDILAGQGRSGREEYSAVVPRLDFTNRKGKPLEMAFVEINQCELDQPGAYIEELEVQAVSIVAKDREEEEFPAVVADRFLDVGHNVAIQVTAMEVKGRGVMTVKLDVKRSGGKRDTIVDALYALNEDGDVIGGGRWINELDIFAKHCEYEMLLLLEDEVTISNFKVVLATKYELEPVPIVIEKLYQ
ncbi:MAG: hypothetical protein AAF085_06150 [Planctomycetota bacterium]